jgi:hypothetical protein
MILWYATVVFVVTAWGSMNHVRSTLDLALSWECTVTAIVGALVGGFMGIALDHPPYRKSHVPS